MADPLAIVIRTENHDGCTVLSVRGEIDLATAPALQDAVDGVLAGHPPALVLDLSEVDFLGSVGMTILVSAHEALGRSDRFAVVAEGPGTSRPLQLTKLDEIIPIFRTLSDAVAAVRVEG
ncbi:STAS domain-containing protein [Mycolicibacterium confluentis]|uniref:Anti-sigma factor antagonist n=1 Tax=Mycolicibacterium confluentis TaxID=28047 RepID=A0A7I7XU69_9MYCO|nr:STAS domain-containing protein [Mycolicibacterium confluentis]ORV27140.1 anti-anti-sigma factor [Mycolicibacterium confluentis]BBZ32795.1 anti-sigma-F factor antagonist RsfB [Mycolicibacterium confluentis]